MLLGGMPGLVGKARVTHLRSLQESQKVSHGATRYSKGERVRDVRGVG
jgi:MFS family permease